jgi:hypothetical protein
MKKSSGLMVALQAAKNRDVEQPPEEGKGSRGKKSDPRFRQISVLVETEAYNDLKRRIVGTDQDASDVVNALLKGWVEGRFQV